MGCWGRDQTLGVGVRSSLGLSVVGEESVGGWGRDQTLGVGD